MPAAYRIGITKLAMAILYTDFTAAVITDNFFGCLFGRVLSAVNAAGAVCVTCFHRPITSMLHYVTVILRH